MPNEDYVEWLGNLDQMIERMRRRHEKRDGEMKRRNRDREMSEAIETAMQDLPPSGEEGEEGGGRLSVREMLKQVNAAQSAFRKNR